MAGFSNFELDKNLEAKSCELGNFLNEPYQDSYNNMVATRYNTGLINEYYLSTQGVQINNYQNNNYQMEPLPSFHAIRGQSEQPVEHYPHQMNYIDQGYMANASYSPAPSPLLPPLLTPHYIPIPIGPIAPIDYSQAEQCKQNVSFQYQQLPISRPLKVYPNTTGQPKYENYSQQENQGYLTSQVPRMVKEFPKAYHLNRKPTEKKYTRPNRMNHYDTPRAHQADWTPIVVNLKKLGIGPEFTNTSSLLKLFSLFRKLSYYFRIMSCERKILESYQYPKRTNYISNNNFNLPLMIKDISNHVCLTKKAVSHEYFESREIVKLFKSDEIGNSVNSLNQKFQQEIENYEKFQLIQIKYKNGMLLLSNDLRIGIENSLSNLILHIREYTIYMNYIKFKYVKKEDGDVFKSENPLRMTKTKNNGRRIGA